MLALALVLDTADGHLARLQGTASEFGRWLDTNLDEVGDMALHAAIAWSLFQRDQWAAWLVLGMVYAMGKYVFLVGNSTWEQDAPSPSLPLTLTLPREGGGDQKETGSALLTPSPLAGEGWGEGVLRRLAHWAGHADVRWHAWIVLAALGRLDVELIAFAVYFPLRAFAGAVRKAVKRA